MEGLDNVQWRQVAHVETVAIAYHEVTDAHMRTITHADRGEATALGYAVLKVRPNGEYVCDVFLLPRASNDVRRHEERHCHGWAHE